MPEQPALIQCEGKHRYASMKELRRALNRPGHHKQPYRCPHCHGWHLTSRRDLGNNRKRAGISSEE